MPRFDLSGERRKLAGRLVGSVTAAVTTAGPAALSVGEYPQDLSVAERLGDQDPLCTNLTAQCAPT
jgi:hypothetical protein